MNVFIVKKGWIKQPEVVYLHDTCEEFKMKINLAHVSDNVVICFVFICWQCYVWMHKKVYNNLSVQLHFLEGEIQLMSIAMQT